MLYQCPQYGVHIINIDFQLLVDKVSQVIVGVYGLQCFQDLLMTASVIYQLDYNHTYEVIAFCKITRIEVVEFLEINIGVLAKIFIQSPEVLFKRHTSHYRSVLIIFSQSVQQ